MRSRKIEGYIFGFTMAFTYICVLLLPGQSSAFGFVDALNNGTQLPCSSPRCLALGGIITVGVDDAYSVFLNPARIPKEEGGIVSLGMVYGGWKEDTPTAGIWIRRGEDIPLVPYGAAGIGVMENLSVAVGYNRVSSTDYIGLNYICNNLLYPDQVTELQYIESNGDLKEALGGFSYSLSDNLSIGMSGGLRFGLADIYETDYEYIPDSIIVTSHDWSWDENQFCWHGGISTTFDLGTAGLAYTSPTDHYPTRMAIGVMILAEHLKNTKIGFECEIVSPGEEAEYLCRLVLENPTASFLNSFMSVSFVDGSQTYSPTLGFSMGIEMNFNPVTTQIGYFYRDRKRSSKPNSDQYYDYVGDKLTLFGVGVTYSL